jgi:hypothetical protein
MIRRALNGIWCDYCKSRYGKNKDGSWHENAMAQATVTIVSTLPQSKGVTRSYCRKCLEDVQNWPDGTIFDIPAQIRAAESMNV